MKTTLTVDENGILTFPDEFIEKLGWKEGDMLEWIDNHNGSFTLVKKEPQTELDKNREYNLREVDYYTKRAELDAQHSKYYYDFDRNKS